MSTKSGPKSGERQAFPAASTGEGVRRRDACPVICRPDLTVPKRVSLRRLTAGRKPRHLCGLHCQERDTGIGVQRVDGGGLLGEAGMTKQSASGSARRLVLGWPLARIVRDRSSLAATSHGPARRDGGQKLGGPGQRVDRAVGVGEG